MRRQTLAAAGAALSAAALLVAALGSAPSATADAQTPAAQSRDAFGGFKHLVVIYQENHSYDNLYGSWGMVDGQHTNGFSHASTAHRVQISQTHQPFTCLLQNDVNLTVGPLSNRCGSETVALGNGTTTTYDSHFFNKSFKIDNYIKPEDTTCPKLEALFSSPNGVRKGQGDPGGCTRDLVHKFYQEQYQLHGGRMNRYVTGSDAVGLSMGHYDTKALPIYRYLNRRHAPDYVIADKFFQGAFGGSYLNHQYLIAAQPPLWEDAPDDEHSVIDSNGMPRNSYPLYKTKEPVKDKEVTQFCDQPTTVDGFACGNWSINTSLPATQPTAGYGPKIPLIDDTTRDLTIGDQMSDAGVSWAWYAGGWDNAAGEVDGAGYTNGAGPTCSDPSSTPAGPDASGMNAGYPYCPHRSFQFHHQPFSYFARYAPGTSGRERHLQDEVDFLAAANSGNLKKVSFVKPLGSENEHPGYASEPNGSDHLVDLIKAVQNGPDGNKTLILVTYDEFGGQWDHVSPPGTGRRGAHDEFGPGTRVPALFVAKKFRSDGVDHRSYDTTSIMATIERQYGLDPVDHPSGVTPRDRKVRKLTNAIQIGMQR